MIILDLDMPVVSGQDVLHDLRKQAHTRKIPVVVVTGSTDNPDDVNVACVLRKPVHPDELVQVVRRCLATKEIPGDA